MRRVLALMFMSVLAAGPAAAQAPDVAAEAGASDKVVVGVVEDVSSRFAENEFGDRLIVSDVWVRTEETLKGTHENLIPIEVEGGTIGDLTLRVSDLPVLQKGDRGLFLLDARRGKNRLHGRGNGVLKLDRSDRVVGTDIRLSDLKVRIKARQK